MPVLSDFGNLVIVLFFIYGQLYVFIFLYMDSYYLFVRGGGRGGGLYFLTSLIDYCTLESF